MIYNKQSLILLRVIFVINKQIFGKAFLNQSNYIE